MSCRGAEVAPRPRPPAPLRLSGESTSGDSDPNRSLSGPIPWPSTTRFCKRHSITRIWVRRASFSLVCNGDRGTETGGGPHLSHNFLT